LRHNRAAPDTAEASMVADRAQVGHIGAMTDRRRFLAASITAALGAALLPGAAMGAPAGPFGPLKRRPAIKPKRLAAGQTIGLVIPSSANWDPTDIDVIVDTVTALGLKPKLGKHVNDRYGYMAGRDEDRAADLNAMFKDPEVDAIHCIRGGWGAARLLPLLDFDAIAKNPKILVGYSDITALHLAIQARTGLITFHGPNGASSWNEVNRGWMQKVLWQGEAARFANPTQATGFLTPQKNRTRTVTPGKARGRLIGGNLTVFTALIGSRYIPDVTGAILFLEDINEEPYRIDRMFTQLRLAGILDAAAGLVWGACSKCEPGERTFGSLTIPDILNDHVKPLGVPAYSGAMFGHISEQFTLPHGGEVELDADAGVLTMLQPAVI
jgi:muramoyltetrapeptide carboxypeptidase